MILLALLLTYLPPSQDVRREHYHVIEQNTVFNETDECDKWPLLYKPTFTQFLFRHWEPSTGQMEIHAWRMLKGYPVEERESFEGYPEEIAAELAKQPLRARTTMAVEKNAAGLWEMRWLDGDVLRIITADSYVRTQTVGDVEVEERSRFDKSLRRELRRK
jgi:hypothetical protein